MQEQINRANVVYLLASFTKDNLGTIPNFRANQNISRAAKLARQSHGLELRQWQRKKDAKASQTLEIKKWNIEKEMTSASIRLLSEHVICCPQSGLPLDSAGLGAMKFLGPFLDISWWRRSKLVPEASTNMSPYPSTPEIRPCISNQCPTWLGLLRSEYQS